MNIEKRSSVGRVLLAMVFAVGLLPTIAGPVAGLSTVGATVGCKPTLTAEQANLAHAMVGPDCAALGGGVSYLSGAAGNIVAVLCTVISNDIINAETITVIDGGAGAIDVTSKVPVTAPAGCAVVPIPGDAYGQSACLELHGRILAAGVKRSAAKVSK